MGPAPGAALRMLFGAGVRHSRRQERRLLRPLPDTPRGDAPVGPHHEAVHREAVFARRPGTGLGDRQQGRAATARPDEAVDGSAHPPLQALHRGLPRTGRRSVRGGRGAKGGIRGLSRCRRHQQALSLQDPGTELRPSAGHGPSDEGTHAGRRCRRARLDRHRVRRGGPVSVRRLHPVQPESFEFSPENLEWAKVRISRYPEGRQFSAVIPLLWRAQERCGGWRPEPALRYVADMLEMPYLRVYEVATFYTMFNLSPVGRSHVQLCGTTPCMLRGSEDLKAVCRRVIGEPGEVTDDGALSWVEAECLGACVNAPVALINNDYYEDLTPESFETILTELRAGRVPKPGPQVDRINSAPVGGP